MLLVLLAKVQKAIREEEARLGDARVPPESVDPVTLERA